MQSRFRLLMPHISQEYSNIPPTIAPKRLYPNLFTCCTAPLQDLGKSNCGEKDRDHQEK